MRPVLLSDVLDDGLHHLLPAVGLHRVDVLHDLRGESEATVDHPRSLHPVDGDGNVKGAAFFIPDTQRGKSHHPLSKKLFVDPKENR